MVSVVVPTYRRPDHLRRCLDGLDAQTQLPEQIVVVRRFDDEPTRRVLLDKLGLPVTEVLVSSGGVLTAMAAGVSRTIEPIVAFTDDDAVPRPDWIARICTLFGDRSVGAVGGRDLLHPTVATIRPSSTVGRVTRWGKVIGNHHAGVGPPREVAVLKAVNMAFRRQALRLPVSLRGTGAQAHFEVATCLWARRHGWRLVYDPQLVVDHYPGPRFDADQRKAPDREAVRDAAYNLVFGLLAGEPALYWRRAAYGLGIGDRGAPGLGRAGVAALTGDWRVLHNLIPSLQGQVAALRDVRKGAVP